MNSLGAAIRFLTILPLPAGRQTTETDLARSIPFFSVVGLLLGIIAAGAGSVLQRFTPQPVAAVLLLLLLLAFSGGLHLDGLADTADGIFSARSREDMLAIMRDHHIGALGAAAVVCLLLLKFAALSSLPRADFWRAALLMPLAGRCALVFHLAWLPYARPQGLGSAFFKAKSGWAATGAAGLLALTGTLLLGKTGSLLAVLCLALAGLLAAWFFRKLGGATGDTLGAACELLELAPLLFLTARTQP